jgi:hypothetical protein
MTPPLVAKALGAGMELAALTPYKRWQELLVSRESIGDTVVEPKDGSFATYELMAVQELNEGGAKSIEVRVLASDGRKQMSAYFYATPAGAEQAT